MLVKIARGEGSKARRAAKKVEETAAAAAEAGKTIKDKAVEGAKSFGKFVGENKLKVGAAAAGLAAAGAAAKHFSGKKKDK
jgi:hypothetical protein